jgi:hypothetical protein
MRHYEIMPTACIFPTDSAVFKAYRELIEDLASEAFDTEGPFGDHGRILATSEALAPGDAERLSRTQTSCALLGGAPPKRNGPRRLVLRPFQGTDPRIGIV